MKIERVQRLLAALACLGMLSEPVLAAPPVVAPAVADVAMSAGGVFTGKVVTAQGVPMEKTEVSLQQAGVEIAKATTNEEGVFAVQGLRGGLYQVVAGGGMVSYRLWAAKTAPPIANRSALIVTGEEVLNGQHCGSVIPAATHGRGGGVMGWARQNPLLVAAGIATAIAVPLALADDDDPAS